jgi:hypothetical protein
MLLDADGPFKGCDGGHCEHPLEELPHTPPPDGMFEPEDFDDAATTAAASSAPKAARNTGRTREHTISRGSR